MGTKGTTTMPITMRAKAGEFTGEKSESYVKAAEGVITTASGGMPIQT